MQDFYHEQYLQGVKHHRQVPGHVSTRQALPYRAGERVGGSPESPEQGLAACEEAEMLRPVMRELVEVITCRGRFIEQMTGAEDIVVLL